MSVDNNESEAGDTVFGKDLWIDEVKRWPVATVVGFVMTAIAKWIGVPTLDQLSLPLTGLGYVLLFFLFSFLAVALLRFTFGDRLFPPLGKTAASKQAHSQEGPQNTTTYVAAVLWHGIGSKPSDLSKSINISWEEKGYPTIVRFTKPIDPQTIKARFKRECDPNERGEIALLEKSEQEVKLTLPRLTLKQLYDDDGYVEIIFECAVNV